MSEYIADDQQPIFDAEPDQPTPETPEYLGGELVGMMGRGAITLSSRQGWIRK